MSRSSCRPRTKFSTRRLRSERLPCWQRVASINEIDLDGVLGLDVEGSPVALYRLGSEVFATAGICTHALAILSDGFVDDGKIECPLHQGQFDIRSGKALCAPATEDLRTYAVKLEGDDVFIDMERPAASVVTNATPDRKAEGGVRTTEEENKTDTGKIARMNVDPVLSLTKHYVWPAEGLTRIPDWVYTDQTIYEREVERIFHGRTWNYVALECEVPKAGDFIRSNVGPTPVVVVRADDGSINVVENRCSHSDAGLTERAACPPTSTPRSTGCVDSMSRRTAASCSPPTSAIWNHCRTISGRRCLGNSRRPLTAASRRFWATTATRCPAIGSFITRISRTPITPRCCILSW